MTEGSGVPSREVGCPLCGYTTLKVQEGVLTCPYACHTFVNAPDWLIETSKARGTSPRITLQAVFDVVMTQDGVVLVEDPEPVVPGETR